MRSSRGEGAGRQDRAQPGPGVAGRGAQRLAEVMDSEFVIVDYADPEDDPFVYEEGLFGDIFAQPTMRCYHDGCDVPRAGA